MYAFDQQHRRELFSFYMSDIERMEQPAHIRAGVSEECFHRLIAWEQALQKAISNLRCSFHLWGVADDSRLEYEIFPGNGNHWIHVRLTAAGALAETAVILVRQVFSTGAEGDLIAANDAGEVQRVRNEMVAFTKTQLGWPQDEYTTFYRFVKDRRNQRLAHYDGEAANITKPVEGVTSMALVGANLNVPEQEKLLAFITPMYEFLSKKLFPRA